MQYYPFWSSSYITPLSFPTPLYIILSKVFTHQTTLTSPWPECIAGYSFVPVLLCHAQNTHRHAILGHGVRHMILKPARAHIEWWWNVEDVRVGALQQVGDAELGPEGWVKTLLRSGKESVICWLYIQYLWQKNKYFLKYYHLVAIFLFHGA